MKKYLLLIFIILLGIKYSYSTEVNNKNNGLFIKYTYISGYVLTEDGDTLKEATIKVIYEKKRRVVGTFHTDPATGRFGFEVRRKRKFQLSIEVEGYFTHIEYIYTNKYKEALNRDIIIPDEKSKIYQIFFEDDIYRVVDDVSKRVLENLSVDLQFSSDYVVELDYDNRDPLIKRRKQEIRKFLVADGINDNRIIDPNKYSSDEDPYFILRINNGAREYEDGGFVDDSDLNPNPELEDGEDVTIHDGDGNNNNNNDGNGGFVSGGCAVVHVENIFFDDNDYETTEPNAVDNMNTVGEYLLNNPNTVLEIVGYADGRGSEEYNKELGIKRAIFIKEYIVAEHHVESQNILVSSYGEGSPMSTNDLGIDEQAYNRRAEFKIFKQEGEAQPFVIKQRYIANDIEIKRWQSKPSSSDSGFSHK